MPSVVAKRPKIPAGILGRGANIHRQIPHEGGREGSEETPQNFHPGRMGLASGKGAAKLIRENVVDCEMVEVRQKWPTLDTQGNEVYVFLI